MRDLLQRLLVLGTVATACAVGTLPVHAQVATAPELKAAFLLNFLKFTRWPASVAPDGGDLKLCVLGDNRVVIALDEMTGDQKIDGRRVVIVALNDRDDVLGCHLLYASGLRPVREQSLVDTTRGRPILTASDSSSFMRSGGITAFHISGGRMKFSVNPSAAERSQLRISSKMLSLAVIVKEGVDGAIR